VVFVKYRATLTIELETGSDETSVFDHFQTAANTISALRYRLLNPESGRGPFTGAGPQVTRIDVSSLVALEPVAPRR
jgi:hypothetical protein